MQAAFVNIGLERNAFLYVDDALAYRNVNGIDVATADSARNHAPRVRAINEIVSDGQSILVQLTKERLETKGARVVTNLSIPGRYLVLMPTVDYIGISRRIQDEAERERLRSIAKRICPDGTGLIVRTVAEGRDEEELFQDAEFLGRIWRDIEA